MAATNRSLEGYYHLSKLERDFIIDVLKNVNLSGNQEALRKAFYLIDSICKKLSD